MMPAWKRECGLPNLTDAPGLPCYGCGVVDNELSNRGRGATCAKEQD
jgi:hypothetical protein